MATPKMLFHFKVFNIFLRAKLDLFFLYLGINILMLVYCYTEDLIILGFV